MESFVAKMARSHKQRKAAPDKSTVGLRRLAPETLEAEAFLLGEAKAEIDARLDRLGTGIEREIATMDEVLRRLRKTPIVT
jgi:hypothetical protein